MKVKFKSISVIVLVAVLVFQSCSNEDDGAVLIDEVQLDDIQGRIEEYQESVENIQTPASMDQYIEENPYASNAALSLATLQIQALIYSSVFLTIPDTAEQQRSISKSGRNENVWVWSYGGTTLYYTVTSDAAFDYFEYDIEQDNVRSTFYEGKISKDGTFYQVKFNGEQGEFFLMHETFVWSANGTGQYINHTTGETFLWP